LPLEKREPKKGERWAVLVKAPLGKSKNRCDGMNMKKAVCWDDSEMEGEERGGEKGTIGCTRNKSCGPSEDIKFTDHQNDGN